MGYGVSACATCDGFFFRDKEIVVIGGGDTAMEEALYLTKFASKVTVIHRRDELRASKIMQDRAMANEKIEWLWDAAVEEILGSSDARCARRRVRNVKTDETERPRLSGRLRRHRAQAQHRALRRVARARSRRLHPRRGAELETNIEGVFASGDAIDPSYRQAVTAAGTGCKAAIDAERWLETLD